MVSDRRRRRAPTAATHNTEAIQRRILPARDATPIRSFLWYARNKVGKTTLCASAAELGKTLIIDCEEGTSSIRDSEAEVYKLTEWDEIDEIYWYLANQDHGYKFVAIDPITRLGQHCMTKVLRDAGRTTPEQRDWGTTAELVRDVVGRYKGLTTSKGLYLMITAYERRRNNDDEESDYDFVIGPDAQPAVKGFLMGQMDVIGRLYVKHIDDDEDEEGGTKPERRLRTSPHEFYEAGDRSDRLPSIMREPTMRKILARINSRRNRP